jgi:hypothetical protein
MHEVGSAVFFVDMFDAEGILKPIHADQLIDLQNKFAHADSLRPRPKRLMRQ